MKVNGLEFIGRDTGFKFGRMVQSTKAIGVITSYAVKENFIIDVEINT
jgi:hypothetical protein